MPLRDHFHPPFSDRESWDGFHGGWPMTIATALGRILPPGFSARPTIRLGAGVEVDVATFQGETAGKSPPGPGGTKLVTLPQPTLTVTTEAVTADEYGVRVFDTTRARQLVAAIEIVSPSNKDRPEHRREFVAKCASFLRQGVSVSIVDLVTVRRANLYLDLLDFFGRTDQAFEVQGSALYAVTCAGQTHGTKWQLKSWAYPMAVGERLPTLPIILTDSEGVTLDLEPTYEGTLRAFGIE